MLASFQVNEPSSVGRSFFRFSRLRFRLPVLLWLYAIFASALTTFDTIEEYACALAFLWVWLTIVDKVIKQSRLSFSSLELIVNFLIFIALAALCYPAVTRYCEEECADLCRKKMRHIAQALFEYKSQHRVLPTAQVRTGENSFDSWRTLILPYLAVQEDRQQHSLDCGDPSDRSFDHYFSGCQFGSSASYFAVTGAETTWDTLQSKNGRISDKPGETILFLEELGRGFDWRESRDLSVEEAFQLLTQPVGNRYVHLSSGKPSYFEKPNRSHDSEGVNIAFADGSVRFANLPLSEELAIALLTAHGGEMISASDIQPLWGKELDYKKIYSFSAFAVLGLLPGFRLSFLWRNLFQMLKAQGMSVRGHLACCFEEILTDNKNVLTSEAD